MKIALAIACAFVFVLVFYASAKADDHPPGPINSWVCNNDVCVVSVVHWAYDPTRGWHVEPGP